MFFFGQSKVSNRLGRFEIDNRLYQRKKLHFSNSPIPLLAQPIFDLLSGPHKETSHYYSMPKWIGEKKWKMLKRILWCEKKYDKFDSQSSQNSISNWKTFFFFQFQVCYEKLFSFKIWCHSNDTWHSWERSTKCDTLWDTDSFHVLKHCF
jgi:hypothetical protein